MQTVSHIQHLMQREGAFFHPLIQVVPIPEMGGGYGVVAEGNLSPGTILARIPQRLMVTPNGARCYLARCEYQWRHAHLAKESPLNEEFDVIALLSLERELLQRLSPGNTLICFLLFSALQHGRFLTTSPWKTWDATAISEEQGNTDVICMQPWIREWLLSLPTRYDNLLELRPQDDDVECVGADARDAYLRPFFCFQRHREKVLHEQDTMEAEFRACQSVLSLLKAVSCTGSESSSSQPVNMEQFAWAYNTLMTRGFAYNPEVWAIMPWVDYFNYALSSNATMSFDEEKGEYIFETLLPIKSGEQILLPYGSYTDMELLLWYGFTLTPSLMPELYSNFNGRNHENRKHFLRMLMFSGSGHDDTADVSLIGRDDTWLKAVQRSLGYLFAPWAEADGTYPHHDRGELWLELLFSSYVKSRSSVKDENGDGLYSLPDAVAKVDVLAEVICGIMHRSPPSQLLLCDSRLGARGPSPSMLKLLKYISRSCNIEDKRTCWTPSDVLRSICWAELFCNDCTSNNNSGGTACSLGLLDEMVIHSLDRVRRMAWQASLDAALLLQFLAVEATETELSIYLSRSCE